jgi:O-acetylhomoserine/O-acetylserine sulfhydrylase-like pyridoxal-dependent enzyme
LPTGTRQLQQQQAAAAAAVSDAGGAASAANTNALVAVTAAAAADAPTQQQQRAAPGGIHKLVYSRPDNPTYVQAEAVIAALDGGVGAALFASGMAAAAAMATALLRVGDRMVGLCTLNQVDP